MARSNIQHDEQGRPLIQFTGPDKRRRKIRLSDLSKRDAERFADKLHALRRAVKFGSKLDDDVCAWAENLRRDHSELFTKLVEYGVMPKALQPDVPAGVHGATILKTVGDLLTAYMKHVEALAGDKRKKPATLKFYGHTKRNLLEFFGESTPLKSISDVDAEEFEAYLGRKAVENLSPREGGGAGLSSNTVNRRCVMAGQFFRFAVRRKAIPSNPFEGVGGVVKSNKARVHYISREVAAEIFKACPNLEWRLRFALSRFAGLRTPSEPKGLRVSDINWDKRRFLVHSPKTEHHPNGQSRWVPIFKEFPELAAALDEAWHAAETGDGYLVPNRNRENLGREFRKILKRAGVNDWPKLFHNMRSSCQTDLMGVYSIHKVCAWLGNSPRVALEHYTQVTEADYALASGAVSGHSGAILSDLVSSPSDRHQRKELPRALVSAVGSSENQTEWAIQDSNL
ncbi:MAG: site-specific integrase [Planctomycetaceae bacterium]|nr:site-specific integrase [Planctomycetaceae bacterium]